MRTMEKQVRKPIRISQKEILKLYRDREWWMVYSFYRFCELMQRCGAYNIYDYDKRKVMHLNVQFY
nr:MAG TPA: hypothetical protein [Caudoviricetes sp.]